MRGESWIDWRRGGGVSYQSLRPPRELARNRYPASASHFQAGCFAVCVCVCACEREREREGKRGQGTEKTGGCTLESVLGGSVVLLSPCPSAGLGEVRLAPLLLKGPPPEVRWPADLTGRSTRSQEPQDMRNHSLG